MLLPRLMAVKLARLERGERSLIWFSLIYRYIRPERTDKDEMSAMLFVLRVRLVRLVRPEIGEMLTIWLLPSLR